MNKKLNTDIITNDLEGSAFFPSKKPQQQQQEEKPQPTPPPHREETVSKLQPAPESPPPVQEPETRRGEEKTQPKPRDVTTSSRHDINYRKWMDIIEDTETHNSALRLTNEERYEIEDLISELRRKYKVKTSMNELARLGLLYIIDDFKKDKQSSLIIKVKKS